MGKKHPINHVEWRTKDSARLQHFYGSLFNWKFSDGGPGYTMVDTGNKELAGGIMQIPPSEPHMHPGISNYITVADLDDYEGKLAELGGKVLMSKQEVPKHGWFTVFADVDGNLMALWQGMGEKDLKKAKKAEKKAKKKAKKAKKGDAQLSV